MTLVLMHSIPAAVSQKAVPFIVRAGPYVALALLPTAIDKITQHFFNSSSSSCWSSYIPGLLLFGVVCIACPQVRLISTISYLFCTALNLKREWTRVQIRRCRQELEMCAKWDQGKDQRMKLLNILVQEAKKCKTYPKEYQEIVKIFFEHFSLLPSEIEKKFVIKTHRKLLEVCPVEEQGKDQHIKLLRSLVQQAKKFKWSSKEHREMRKVFCHYLPVSTLESYLSKDEKRSALEDLSEIQVNQSQFQMENLLGAEDQRVQLLEDLIHQACLEACPAGAEGRDQRMRFLSSLVEEAKQYPWRSEKHIEIANIFFEHFSLLPLEDRFPIREGKEDVKQLFISLEKYTHKMNWSDPVTDRIHQFQQLLSPVQEERFVKILPLHFISFTRLAGIREVSRREASMNDHDFKSLFDFYVGVKGGQYILHNGAEAFIQGISTPLLKRVLDHYSDHFHLAENIVRAFKTIPFLEEAQEKLLTFIEWYPKYQAKWNPYRQAHRLFFILSMAVAVIERSPVSCFKRLREREIGSLRKTELSAAVLEQMVRGCIPKKYSSWDVFAADLQNCDREEGEKQLSKFFQREN